jgi:hypothetical protein
MLRQSPGSPAFSNGSAHAATARPPSSPARQLTQLHDGRGVRGVTLGPLKKRSVSACRAPLPLGMAAAGPQHAAGPQQSNPKGALLELLARIGGGSGAEFAAAERPGGGGFVATCTVRGLPGGPAEVRVGVRAGRGGGGRGGGGREGAWRARAAAPSRIGPCSPRSACSSLHLAT